MSFTLINARPSPFGRKVAIALIEKGLDYNVRYDLPWGEGTCTPEFSPLEQLPILITGEDEKIYDSSYILEWLEVRFPEPPLVPTDPDQRLAALKRKMLGERLMEIAQQLILELHRPEPGSAWVDRQTRKLCGGLAELERLYAGRPAENQLALDVGDIAVATSLLLFEFAMKTGLSPEIDAIRWRQRYPALTLQIERLEQRPSFTATQPQEMEIDLNATVR